MRILIVDDHPVVRRGLRQILEEGLERVTIGEASNPHECLAALGARGWDVVLLDLSMPGRSGVELIAQIKEQGLPVAVLVLSIHAEGQFAVRALRAGAAGYLNKEAAPERLVEAVQRVAAGGRYLSDTVADLLAGAVQQTGNAPLHEQLSNREFDVFRKLSAGHLVGQIARELSLSEKTVSTYRARVLDKMSMKTNVDLARYAVANGLV